MDAMFSYWCTEKNVELKQMSEEGPRKMKTHWAVAALCREEVGVFFTRVYRTVTVTSWDGRNCSGLELKWEPIFFCSWWGEGFCSANFLFGISYKKSPYGDSQMGIMAILRYLQWSFLRRWRGGGRCLPCEVWLKIPFRRNYSWSGVVCSFTTINEASTTIISSCVAGEGKRRTRKWTILLASWRSGGRAQVPYKSIRKRHENFIIQDGNISVTYCFQ